jgi:hypothetical protein
VNIVKLSLISLLGLLSVADRAMAAPTAYLEDASVAAVGKTISISRLPVTNSTGTVLYKDVVINLAVNASGNLTFATVPSVTISPSPTPTKFVAGRYYVSVSGTNYFGSLTSAVGAGGSTIWTLTMDLTPEGGYPQESVWQTGAPAPDVASRLATAKVAKNPNYSYGTSPEADGSGFYNNGLLAAEQINNKLTLVSYTYNSAGPANDQRLPYASIVLGLCNNAACTNAPAQ